MQEKKKDLKNTKKMVVEFKKMSIKLNNRKKQKK